MKKRIPIRKLEDILLKIKFNPRMRYSGWYYPGENMMVINSHKALSRIAETLFHEFTHFVMYFVSREINKDMPKEFQRRFRLDIDESDEKICGQVDRYCMKKVNAFFRKRLRRYERKGS